MNQLLDFSNFHFGAPHRHCTPVSTLNTRFTLCKALTFLIILGLSLTQPLLAQTTRTPLGGPKMDVVDTGAVIRVRPISQTTPNPPGTVTSQPSNRPSTGTRLAEVKAGTGTAADKTEGTTTASAQGALPIDLGVIRRLKVANKLIEDTPLRVGNVDILAPIVPELQRLGASATRASIKTLPGNPNTPTEDQIFQINLPQGAPIVLTIGKRTAYINNIEQPLREAPLVIRDKIWLPIFSIAPLLGASTRLERDGTLHVNPTIQSVELFPVKGMIAMTVQASAPIPPGSVLMGTLDNPPKVYFDFSGYSMGFDAANSTIERAVSAGLGDVEKVRAGMFQSFPDVTRVVLDLKREMKVVYQPVPDRRLYPILLMGPGSTAAIPAIAGNPNPPASGPNSLRGLTIVVDAGHGGHDFGAGGARSREKDLTLDIARRVRYYLFARGATVLMSRDGDYFVPLQGRVDFANSRKADIFFSVHINSYQPSSSGTETYFYTAPSLALAREVHKELVKATGLKNRGVIQERFFVIRKTWMPSVLTECGFISNPREEALLNNPEWRERVARGMAQGIANYVQNYIRPSGTAG